MADSRSVVQSAIGMKFLDSQRTAVALAMVTVAVDLACVSNPSYGEVRACFAMIMFAFAVYLSGGDLKSLGLRRSPVPGWARWISISFRKRQSSWANDYSLCRLPIGIDESRERIRSRTDKRSRQPAIKVLSNEVLISQRRIGIDDSIQFDGLVGRQYLVRI